MTCRQQKLEKKSSPLIHPRNHNIHGVRAQANNNNTSLNSSLVSPHLSLPYPSHPSPQSQHSWCQSSSEQQEKETRFFHRPCMQLVFKGLLRSCSELRTPPPKTSITEDICNWKFKGLLHTCSELGTPPPKTSLTEDILQLDKRLNIYTQNNTESTPRASKS